VGRHIMHVPERQMFPEWALTVCGLEVGTCVKCGRSYCRCDEPGYALPVVTTGKPATCEVCIARLEASDKRVPKSKEEWAAEHIGRFWAAGHFWTVEHPSWRIP
jgi:hypothetical protein